MPIFHSSIWYRNKEASTKTFRAYIKLCRISNAIFFGENFGVRLTINDHLERLRRKKLCVAGAIRQTMRCRHDRNESNLLILNNINSLYQFLNSRIHNIKLQLVFESTVGNVWMCVLKNS